MAGERRDDDATLRLRYDLRQLLADFGSDGVKLGFWALVESLIMRSTPISLNFDSAPKSVVTPSMGV